MRRFLESYFLKFFYFWTCRWKLCTYDEANHKRNEWNVLFFVRYSSSSSVFYFFFSLRFALLCYTMENNLNVWQRLSTLRVNVSIRTETECVESKYEISEDSSIYCTNVHTILCCSQMLSSSSLSMLLFLLLVFLPCTLYACICFVVYRG